MASFCSLRPNVATYLKLVVEWAPGQGSPLGLPDPLGCPAQWLLLARKCRACRDGHISGGRFEVREIFPGAPRKKVGLRRSKLNLARAQDFGTLIHLQLKIGLQPNISLV